MKQSWLQRRWPAIRAKGRAHFVLVRGVLLWGGLMTTAVYVMLLASSSTRILHFGAVFPLVPLLCLPAGAFWGLLSWHWNDYLYKRLGFHNQ
jgi:hypothetical protein